MATEQNSAQDLIFIFKFNFDFECRTKLVLCVYLENRQLPVHRQGSGS